MFFTPINVRKTINKEKIFSMIISDEQVISETEARIIVMQKIEEKVLIKAKKFCKISTFLIKFFIENLLSNLSYAKIQNHIQYIIFKICLFVCLTLYRLGSWTW
jgi:hypothetical protein